MSRLQLTKFFLLTELGSQPEQKIQKKGPSFIHTLVFKREGTPCSVLSYRSCRWFSTTPEAYWFPFTYSSPSRSRNTSISFCRSFFKKILLPFRALSARPHKYLLDWSLCGKTSVKQTSLGSNSLSWNSPLNQVYYFLERILQFTSLLKHLVEHCSSVNPLDFCV